MNRKELTDIYDDLKLEKPFGLQAFHKFFSALMVKIDLYVS